MVDLSVVVPVYRCVECLRELHRRLTEVLDNLSVSYELIFVDDASDDDSWNVLLELSRSGASVNLVRLSRNFGQHAAITAGLAESAWGR